MPYNYTRFNPLCTLFFWMSGLPSCVGSFLKCLGSIMGPNPLIGKNTSKNDLYWIEKFSTAIHGSTHPHCLQSRYTNETLAHAHKGWQREFNHIMWVWKKRKKAHIPGVKIVTCNPSVGLCLPRQGNDLPVCYNASHFAEPDIPMQVQ